MAAFALRLRLHENDFCVKTQTLCCGCWVRLYGNGRNITASQNRFVLRIHSASFSHGIHVNEKNGTLRLRFSVIWKQNFKMANPATIAVLVLDLSTATLVLYQLANAMMHRHRAYLHHRRLRTSLLLASPLRIRSCRQRRPRRCWIRPGRTRYILRCFRYFIL